MSPNIKLHITHGLIILGIVVVSIGFYFEETLQYYFIWIGSIIAIIYGMITVRCPFCHRQLPLIGIGTEYCPHCGEHID